MVSSSASSWGKSRIRTGGLLGGGADERDQPPGPSFVPAALPTVLSSHAGGESPYPRRCRSFPAVVDLPIAHRVDRGGIDWLSVPASQMRRARAGAACRDRTGSCTACGATAQRAMPPIQQCHMEGRSSACAPYDDACEDRDYPLQQLLHNITSFRMVEVHTCCLLRLLACSRIYTGRAIHNPASCARMEAALYHRQPYRENHGYCLGRRRPPLGAAGRSDGRHGRPWPWSGFHSDIPLSMDIWWEWPGLNRLLHRGSRGGQRSMVSPPRYTSSCNSAPDGPHSHIDRSFLAVSPCIGH